MGVGIFLVAVGAILAFAVNATTNVANLQTIGIILMIVGALGIVLDLILFAPRRRRSTSTTTTSSAAYPGERTVVAERQDVL